MIEKQCFIAKIKLLHRKPSVLCRVLLKTHWMFQMHQWSIKVLSKKLVGISLELNRVCAYKHNQIWQEAIYLIKAKTSMSMILNFLERENTEWILMQLIMSSEENYGMAKFLSKLLFITKKSLQQEWLEIYTFFCQDWTT